MKLSVDCRHLQSTDNHCIKSEHILYRLRTVKSQKSFQTIENLIVAIWHSFVGTYTNCINKTNKDYKLKEEKWTG